MSGEPPTDPTPGRERPTVPDLPAGYEYGVTRYADEILRNAFSQHYRDLVEVLEGFTIDLSELQASGGNRTPFVARFDGALEQRGWDKHRFDIRTTIDGVIVAEVRAHEVDMFKLGPEDDPYPGVGVEMEWNNKDPFFDRDLTNFHALHRAGAMAVGVIVTRSSRLQDLLKPTVLNPKGKTKYGESSTHWSKLMDRVHLGGGGECPLLLVGIEPERVANVEIAQQVYRSLQDAADKLSSWRDHYQNYNEARRATTQAKNDALAIMPEPTDAAADEDE